jgi:hypothetical protein
LVTRKVTKLRHKTKAKDYEDERNSLFDSLLEEPQKPSGPVTCLGMTFENDEARRAHFTEELRKKLQDPEFRKIEGFPIGSDEDILNLSDPPYYTACPNPWIADFIAEWEAQKPEQPEGYHYHREPFAADVSEGKNDPFTTRTPTTPRCRTRPSCVTSSTTRSRGTSCSTASAEPA